MFGLDPRELTLVVFAFVMGASIGSFLNVCIYRLPLGLSVNNPRRSFCPHCKYEFPIWQNLPLISWILLRGKCAKCGKPISPRYLLVELLTALLFLSLWLMFPWPVAVAYWVMFCLLVVATFIDFEHMIIPDVLTLGGAILGLIACFIVPELMREYDAFASPPEWMDRLKGLGWSAFGAVIGYGLMWLIVELGKLAFGRKRASFKDPIDWKIREEEEYGDIIFENEKGQYFWEDMFFRPTDCLRVNCTKLKLNDRKFSDVKLEVYREKVFVDGEEFTLEGIKVLEGKTDRYVVPREAMGMGDVKFMAMIGAFAGWKGVLFTVFGASFYGLFAALVSMLLGNRDLARRIPFGPYLAMSAATWVFAGPWILEWYLDWVAPPR